MPKYRVLEPIAFVGQDGAAHSYARGSTVTLTAEQALAFGEAVGKISFFSAFPPNPDDDFAVRVDTPSGSSDEGSLGQWALNSTHLYLCVAENTWRRVEIGDWE